MDVLHLVIVFALVVLVSALLRNGFRLILSPYAMGLCTGILAPWLNFRSASGLR